MRVEDMAMPPMPNRRHSRRSGACFRN